MDTYKIVRKFFKGEDEVIETGLTLEEAQEHCQDPETSSKTCTGHGRTQHSTFGFARRWSTRSRIARSVR